ncbi:MAG TPA: hypothetical protein VK970_25650 [Candidatus Methylacidiphilales bacterium]|nr:hypothetical protein [Candidatus Methylacidiphilales bacterium]
MRWTLTEQPVVLSLGLGLCMAFAGCGPSSDIEIRHNVAKEVERPLPGAPNASGQTPGMPARENIPIAYITPEGWKEEPASGFRNASFLIGGNDGATSDVSISTLSTMGSSLLDNVNRWRAQVKLPPLAAASELTQNCREETIDGKRWIWVDITGPAPAASASIPASANTPATNEAPAAQAEPKAPPMAPMMQPKSGNPARFAQRITAAMFVAEPRVWFIKMSGDEPVVTAQQANFQALVASFKFANAPGETPAAPGSGTLSGQPASPSSATGGPQAPAPASTAGADPHAAATPQQMEQMRARMKATGELAERNTNSITAPASPIPSPSPAGTSGASGAPASAPSPAPAPGGMNGPIPTGAAVKKPAWKVPPGWEEKEAKPPRIATFIIGSAAGPIEISVTSFPGDVGGKLANINRWRGQIGLQPWSAEALAKEAQTFITTPGGKEATLVFFAAPAPEATGTAAAESNALMAVIVFDGTQSWFFKATGPLSVMGKQRQNMIDFVQSCGF